LGSLARSSEPSSPGDDSRVLSAASSTPSTERNSDMTESSGRRAKKGKRSKGEGIFLGSEIPFHDLGEKGARESFGERVEIPETTSPSKSALHKDYPRA